MIVVYSNGSEIIFGNEDDESAILNTYFVPETGRDVNDYERTLGEMFDIQSSLKVREN